MLCLHAVVCKTKLFLWAEIPENRAAKRTAKAVPLLPNCAAETTLREAILAGELALPPEATAREVTILLPTQNGRAIPSSPLLGKMPDASMPDSSQPAHIAAWRVRALEMPIKAASALLESVGGRSMATHGVLIGRDLAFWETAWRFAQSLAVRGQFLPEVIEDGETFRAVWQPLFSEADEVRRTKLARAMPHAARAATAEKVKADALPDVDTLPSAPSADRALRDFLQITLDAVVRGSTPAAFKPARTAPTFDSLHEQWMHALSSADNALRAEAKEVQALLQQVATWQRPLQILSGAPWRLCFRLEEPPLPDEAEYSDRAQKGQSNAWTLSYHLQARDDLSLFVPLSQAWRGRLAGAALRREGFAVREYLTGALGQAATLCDEIATSLKSAAPAGCALDAAAAHRFLSETAPALESAGFGILLPSWWSSSSARARLTARADVKQRKSAMQGGGGITLDDLVQFDWQIALGDEPVSFAELEGLAQLKAPLVRFRKQWVQLDSTQIQAALALFKNGREPQTTLRELLRMELGAGEETALPFEGVSAHSEIGELLEQLKSKSKFDELPAPTGFVGTLRPYQLRGFSWLAFLHRCGLGACLADDMGLGKTPTTLAFLQSRVEAGETRPTLLICPTSVLTNWQRETTKFTPDLKTLVHHGTARKSTKAFEEYSVVLTSYALLHRDFETLQKVSWAGVVLDEAQNIKNAQTLQAKAARALKADFRIALTGTPVENNVGDLWSVMEFLNPGLLSTQAGFKRQFFTPIQNGDEEAAARLQKLTGPFILRRLKTDRSIITDLPEKQEMKTFCSLTKEQASLYEAVVQQASETLDEAGEDGGIARRGMVLAMLTLLKQVCNHPAQLLGDGTAISGRSGKLSRLTEMLEEVLAVEERALIFTQFREMGELIKTHLQESFGREVLFLHGGVSKKARDRMVERFQDEQSTPDAPRVFILSLKAGGVGLNLTRANHVFHYDRWWNPAVENQATDRAFRIGQTKNVQVHKFLCAGTMEERIDEMIESKQEMARRIVGTGETWLTEFSTRDLKELIKLRQP